MAILGPVNLDAYVVSANRIDMTWYNRDYYDLIEIWENEDGVGYAKIDEIPGTKEYYKSDGLDSDTPYCYQVKGKILEPPYTTPPSNEDCETTFKELADPTNLEVKAISDTKIDVTFKDNSKNEDSHRLERKLGAGEFSEIATLLPNVEFYRDSTGLVKGSTYTYRVRARANGEYSDYSNEDSATTISEPSGPSSLTIENVEDKRLRLKWTDNSDNETGFKIEKSDTGAFGGEEEEIAVIWADITEFLVRGLDPNTQYWFRVYAYNAAGNSAYSNTVTDTTLAQYERTEFEKFIRIPIARLVALWETNPGTKLTGFTLVGGKTWTYELAITDRAINDFEKVYENGVEYPEKSSINEVEGAEAGDKAFWFDTSSKILYVHTSTGANPSDFYIEGRFLLHIKSGESATFNGNFYYPLLSLENIPSMSQEISAFYGGSFTISSGTISLKNDELTSPKFFDKRFADYLWRDAKGVLKIGEKGFSYSQFKEVFTSLVDSVGCNDKLFTLNLRDLRANLGGPISMNKYSLAEFPLLDEKKKDKVIPKVFGCSEDIMPACIDTENGRWMFHDGPIKEVHEVKVNDVVKTKDTNYYVDYRRGRITFDINFSVDHKKDIVKVHFTGIVDSAQKAVIDGADIFIHSMLNFKGLSLDDLDLDSIYETKYTAEQDLLVSIYKEESFSKIIHRVENSLRASTFQDECGRIGLQVAQTTLPPNAVHVENFRIAKDGHSQEKGSEFLFKEINIFFKENVKDKKWEVYTKSLPEFVYKYGKRKPLEPLDIYTYFHSTGQASALADDIATRLEQLEKGFVNETLSRALYGCRAGDLIKLNRDRFCSSSGTADEITVRLLTLDKMIASNKSVIKGVVIS